ncbi:MAG TPA: SRPBCC family protein [Chitinophagaceae bacterium]
MSSYSLKRVQILPISLDEAWDFFSNPANLNDITPTDLKFKILSNSGSDKMYAGQIITYTVNPFPGFPVFWMTEITHVKEKEYFVDEQRFGPYAFWHHSHFFKPVKEGVEMTDIVHYKLPLGPLGRLAHRLFVRKKLNNIFNYRFQTLESHYHSSQKPPIELKPQHLTLNTPKSV